MPHEAALKNAAARCRERGVSIPTFAQLRDPARISATIRERLAAVGLWDVDPLNLFRITWKNEPAARGGGFNDGNWLEFPSALTGVEARIVGLLGKWFPTGAHKVGAAFGCLVPRLVAGEFDPTTQSAVWPSTGNFCRGGAYDCALLGCTPVAILPQEMSAERFDWLRSIGAEVIATPGCESNVKEIYDKCWEIRRTRPDCVIFNQFEEFGNAVWHYHCTGAVIAEVFERLARANTGQAPRRPGALAEARALEAPAESPAGARRTAPDAAALAGARGSEALAGARGSEALAGARGSEALAGARGSEGRLGAGKGGLRLAAFVSATGSAGTIAAGDCLRTRHPDARVVAAEALQCPTLLSCGFGGHRIEGIGDKHVPWIHNVRNTDLVVAVDDAQCLALMRLFNEDAGRACLERAGVARGVVDQLPDVGISGICNLVAAIKTAKWYELDRRDVIFTPLTDSMELYASRLLEQRSQHGAYNAEAAARHFGRYLEGAGADHARELGYRDRKALHNLKYFTWVEQQGRTVEELERLWDPDFWTETYAQADEWDQRIEAFNRAVAAPRSASAS